MIDGNMQQRIDGLVSDWNLDIDDTLETAGSVVAFGRRREQPVVLKVVRRPGDEWRCGQVLRAFGGTGMVHVLESVDGAVLLERLDPATSLATIAMEGDDREATAILADLIARISHPHTPEMGFDTVARWGRGFASYLEGGDSQIPRDLVEQAAEVYGELCRTQRRVVLLHGDLQHYNVLLDSRRGWLAIDPKGVIGEIEYEIGAALRNPFERPELAASAATVEQRISCFEAVLKLDAERALAWGFAQGVLSAIWSVEDDGSVDPASPSLQLANTIRGMLG